jgi:hypothetical protein
MFIPNYSVCWVLISMSERKHACNANDFMSQLKLATVLGEKTSCTRIHVNKGHLYRYSLTGTSERTKAEVRYFPATEIENEYAGGISTYS